MDSDYLKKHVGPCLVDCLAEVAQKRPGDPVEFIAQWMHKFIHNINMKKKAEKDAARLADQKVMYEQEQQRRSAMKEEKASLAREEFERKMAEVAAAEAKAQDGLPPVTEEPTSEHAPVAEEEEKKDEEKEEKEEVEEAAEEAPAEEALAEEALAEEALAEEALAEE